MCIWSTWANHRQYQTYLVGIYLQRSSKCHALYKYRGMLLFRLIVAVPPFCTVVLPPCSSPAGTSSCVLGICFLSLLVPLDKS